MGRTFAGNVKSLWRYPVKSMQGEALEASEIGLKGLLGDRAYALWDVETNRVASAKNPKNGLLCSTVRPSSKTHPKPVSQCRQYTLPSPMAPPLPAHSPILTLSCLTGLSDKYSFSLLSQKTLASINIGQM